MPRGQLLARGSPKVRKPAVGACRGNVRSPSYESLRRQRIQQWPTAGLRRSALIADTPYGKPTKIIMIVGILHAVIPYCGWNLET
eukprot:6198851-Pleurochrysis_carterae.AAC.1